MLLSPNENRTIGCESVGTTESLTRVSSQVGGGATDASPSTPSGEPSLLSIAAASSSPACCAAPTSAWSGRSASMEGCSKSRNLSKRHDSTSRFTLTSSSSSQGSCQTSSTAASPWAAACASACAVASSLASSSSGCSAQYVATAVSRSFAFRLSSTPEYALDRSGSAHSSAQPSSLRLTVTGEVTSSHPELPPPMRSSTRGSHPSNSQPS
mmetsp:Transcript_11003/g.27691  ORF Transcript_11003/g.27691 Transcript_11003/m.27691 type:complete len:211 (+) Transcript_11003:600-1232(+)